MRDHIQAFTNSTRSMASATSRAQNRSSRVLPFRMDVSASVPFSKHALRALYALANSNCSAPLSLSTARNCKPFSFRKCGPTGRCRFDSTKRSELCFHALLAEDGLQEVQWTKG